MSADRDVTPIVRTWLQDGVTSLPDHVLDRVFDQVPAIRQERGWLVGRRNPAMQNALKLALAAAAVSRSWWPDSTSSPDPNRPLSARRHRPPA